VTPPSHTFQLHTDLLAMVGVWRDHLTAYDLTGEAVEDDPYGGVPGPFPFDNLVYVDFDPSSGRYLQTNVSIEGRDLSVRTFEADVAEGTLRFGRLGPDAPHHVGVSGGPGLIWFVSERIDEPGLARYCEPDLIRLEGDSRWRTTVLWRDAVLVRPLLVTGTRVSRDTGTIHPLDPRGPGSAVHGDRSVTRQYQEQP